jgi:hypothetical protein
VHPIQSERHKNNPQSLAEFYRALPFPSDNELKWLLRQGIAGDTMASPVIRGGLVRFERDGVFDFADGIRAVIFRSDDRGEPVDLVAWQPKTGQLATWRGVGFCIGDVGRVFCPSTYFAGDALAVHKSPLEWLSSGRDGIVIVQPKLTYANFHSGMRVRCTDIELSQQLKRWLRAPARKVEILVEGGTVKSRKGIRQREKFPAA